MRCREINRNIFILRMTRLHGQRRTNSKLECENWTELSSAPSGEQVPGSRASTVDRRDAALRSRHKPYFEFNFIIIIICLGGVCICRVRVHWLYTVALVRDYYFILPPLSLLLLLLLSRRHYDTTTAHHLHRPLCRYGFFFFFLANLPKSWNFVC